MTLYEMIDEVTNISTLDVRTDDGQYKMVLSYRESYRNSLRNTINKKIENLCDAREINELIAAFENKLEYPLVISLYRRYLWLEPANTIMYQKFSLYLGDNEPERRMRLLQAIAQKDFDAALVLVEEIFDNMYLTNKSLIKPINLRTFVDIVAEYTKLDTIGIPSMRKTGANSMRCDYLEKQIKNRTADPNINPVELREFFMAPKRFYITLHCEYGLAIGKRYFSFNKYDREVFGNFCIFLSFWGFIEEERLILQYIAINDFDNALKVVNTIEY